MSQSGITLSDAETMQERLLRFSEEESYVAHLYPQLLSFASEVKMPQNILFTLDIAIHQYANSRINAIPLMQKMDRLIEAMVQEEHDVQAVKDIWARQQI